VTWFVIIAAVMTAVALAWVVPPLLRRRGHGGMVSRQGSNLAVLRDQLAELDADLRNGTIAPEQHARARGELERRTLEDATVDPQAGGGEKAGGRAAAVLVGILIPSLALLLYLLTGNPDGLEPAGIHGDAAATPAQVEQMVSRLAARLEASPEDPNGWSLLGRSYYAMGRYAEAVKAYARAVQLNSEDAGLYADYADALAMSLGRRVDDQVLLLVNQALKIDPDHLKALVMGASAAFDRQDYKTALTYLERLQRHVPPDTQLGRMVTERAEEVRARAGGKTEAPAGGKTETSATGKTETSATGKTEVPAPGKTGAPAAVAASGLTIKGRVALSPALAGKAAATDTVFIVARAPQGPRMPLAVMRRQVKDLPFEFTLGDEQAMSPEMKLSKFSEAVIVARVSKSGNAIPQSGDLQGVTGNVKLGASDVNVLIDTVMP
jgi:cytochrome c-type biogenesis protein CcmH